MLSRNQLLKKTFHLHSELMIDTLVCVKRSRDSAQKSVEQKSAVDVMTRGNMWVLLCADMQARLKETKLSV